MLPLRRISRTVAAVVALSTPYPAASQVITVRPVTPEIVGPSVDELRGLQQGFESFRRQRLPAWSGGRVSADSCDERIGRFCYWYDEDSPDPPAEPASISQARDRLIARLDSAGRAFPNDRWIAGQRVRYLSEAGRHDAAVRAARACTAHEWWCRGIEGFALHVAGRYAESEDAFDSALALMNSRDRCEWRDMVLLLDEGLLRRYRELNCALREQFERDIWWLSRPMLSSSGNDARTEFYSRLMMVEFLKDAPSVYQMGFDTDEQELVIRYGWPRAWTREAGSLISGPTGAVVGHEPTPAHPFIPRPSVLENPASSDSSEWRGKGVAPVRARYSPEYARRLLRLEHQAALFRRGDSALVVAAWAVSDDSLVAAARDGSLRAAFVLSKGRAGDAAIVRLERPGTRGTFTASTSWGSMLMSAEVVAPSKRTLARARYGVRGSDVPGSRVQMSDLLLFDPYEDMPRMLEDAIAHMRTSERIPVGGSVGIYWEAYNTDPAGEGISVSITVAPEETGGGGWFRRGLQALRLVREAQPITMGLRDVTARGSSLSPRAVVVDLSTLTPGRYLMELELDAGGGNIVRAERAITVTRDG